MGAHEVDVWDVARRSRVCRLREDVVPIVHACFVCDSSSLVLTTGDLKLHSILWDLETSSSTRLPACKDPVRCLVPAPQVWYTAREGSHDELVLLESGGTASMSRVSLPTKDAAELFPARSGTACICIDSALSPQAWVLSVLGEAAPLELVLGGGSRDVGLYAECGAVPASALAGDDRTCCVGCHSGELLTFSQDTGHCLGGIQLPSVVTPEGGFAVFEERSDVPPASMPPASMPTASAVSKPKRAEPTRGVYRQARGGSKPAPPPTPSTLHASDAPLSLAAATGPARAGGSRGVANVQFSPCGRFVSWNDLRFRGVVCVAGADGTLLHTVVQCIGRVRAMSWRPTTAHDPALVVVSGSGKLVIVIPSIGTACLVAAAEDFGVRNMAWSPNGRTLLVHNGVEWMLGPPLDETSAD
jgi:hypothetical protein